MNRWLIFIFLAINIMIAFYFWRYWKLMKEIKELQETRQHDRTRSDVFVPTNEWQKISKDQVIPSGLHVRINLQTGEREAKLMSSESDEKKSDDKTSIVMLEKQPPDEELVDDNLRIEVLKQSLENIPYDTSPAEKIDTEDKPRKKFRTYEELKKDMSELKLKVKTDMEVMDELSSRFHKIQKDMKTLDSQKETELLSILKDFEYLLHQVDNAREFVKHNGLSMIILPCLSSNSTQLRTIAARVLGSAVQNNAKVQIFALKAGVITPLLRNIALEKGYDIRSSSLYALSCLVRSFPLAEMKLIEEGGLSVMLSLFDEDTADSLKLQLKVVTFFDDLLLEREDAELSVQEDKLLQNVTDKVAIEEIKMMVEKLKQYNNVGLASKLVEKGWCSKLVRLLIYKVFKTDLEHAVDESSINYDVVDKVSGALLSVFPQCEFHFKSEEKLHSVLKTLFNFYKNLSKTDEDGSFYKDVFMKLDKLCTKLKFM